MNEKYFYTYLDGYLQNGFEIYMTLHDAEKCSHSGDCSRDVERLFERDDIKAQFAELTCEQLKDVLYSCGAWDDEELSIRLDNIHRILWIAAGNIVEENLVFNLPLI